MDQQRNGDAAVVQRVLTAPVRLRRARPPFHHGVHGLEVARVRRQADVDRLAGRGLVHAVGAVVVLHVSRAALGRERLLDVPPALELGEDRLVRQAHDVRQHVEPPTVRHAEHHAARPGLAGELDRQVQHRDERVQALDRKALLAQVGRVQEPLEHLDRREPRQELALLVRRERRAMLAGLDDLAQPHALLMAADVLHLVGDRAAVGLEQLGVCVGQGAAGHVDAQHLGWDARHDLGSEPQGPRVERRVAGRIGGERVEPRCEMAEVTDRLHERHRGRHVLQLLHSDLHPGAWGVGHGGRGSLAGGRGCYAQCPTPHAHALEHALVELIFAVEQRLELAQKHPRLSALDDAVVVGARDRDELRATRLANGAGRDDRGLAPHQARHGGNGADGPGVREGDRAAREVVGEEPTGARLLDQRLVGRVERREIHPLGVLDHRHDERAAAVLLLHVHREAEAHPAGIEAMRLAAGFLERVRHHGEGARRLHDGVADEVGIGDLLAARREPRVQLPAPRVQRVDHDLAEGRGRRDGQRVRHVLNQASRRSGDRG